MEEQKRDCYILFVGNRHHEDNSGRRGDGCIILCTKCDAKFTCKRNLRRHEAIHEEKRFVCRFCGKKFHRNYNLKLHEEGKHMLASTRSSSSPPLRCPTCDARLKTKDTLRKHVKIHGEKKFECRHCKRRFHRLSNQITHEGVCSKDDTLRSFPCTNCNARFTCKKNLKRHEVIHGEKKFECRHCGQKRFHWSVNRRRHEKICIERREEESKS